ncbi:FAD-dependent oxidoreductase [Sinorhizobium saheli]|uniref:FAD-dependent oxidoreductase n=1 Tax=Sinorhizobium saheli TaxID=36856 RepID=A0A178XS91_SINSA|nr:FAD-dependent oxidoreductase [Sinorhizobium saheli]MQW87614.1 FAD-dependent oxidoreductase [Sinorhizobium saheli]OAP38111.1 FAD-dependent oxidoreductase [Sinorhizobium saheli]
MRILNPIPANDPSQLSWWQLDIAPARADMRPPLSGEVSFDVAIVGGGFTGLWTAITLKQRAPRLRIAIIEAFRCGDGASSRNGGNVHGYWGALPTLVPLFGPDKAVEAAELGTLAQKRLRDFARAPGRDVWWVEEGYLRVATSETQMAKRDAFLKLARDLGVPDSVRALDRRELAEMCGSLRFLGGLFFKEGATVHPARLADALRREALDLGVEIFENTPVQKIEKGPTVRIRCSTGSVVARDVVLANYTGTMGLSSVAAATTLFSSFPVMSAPNEVALERMNYKVARGLADLRMFTHYFRRTRDGRILMGSGSGPIALGAAHEAPELRIDARSCARAESGLKRFFPGMAEAGIAARWGWPIEVASDRLPFFGTVSGTRIHFGSGYSGHGVNATCIAGECLASLVLNEKDRWYNSPFCQRERVRFPPEPLRYIGGTMIRNAIVKCEDAEDAGQPQPLLARGIAEIPRVMGMRIGMR